MAHEMHSLLIARKKIKSVLEPWSGEIPDSMKKAPRKLTPLKSGEKRRKSFWTDEEERLFLDGIQQEQNAIQIAELLPERDHGGHGQDPGLGHP